MSWMRERLCAMRKTLGVLYVVLLLIFGVHSIFETYGFFANLPTPPDPLSFVLDAYITGYTFLFFINLLRKNVGNSNVLIRFLALLVGILVFACTRELISQTDISLTQSLIRTIPTYITMAFIGAIVGSY